MTVGVLGGGQLGRMLALAGIPLEIECRFIDPGQCAPAARVGTMMGARFDDEGALRALAEACDVITYEFENVPVAATRAVAAKPVFPPPRALEIAQDRLQEKELFARLGIPAPEYARVDETCDLEAAVAAVGLPAVLKSRRGGYDGKNQHVLRSASDIAGAARAMGGAPAILERFVPFQREVSILAVRGHTQRPSWLA